MKPFLMTRVRKIVPVEFRSLKSCDGIGIRNSLAGRRIVEAGKTCELISPSSRHRRRQTLLKVAEKKKWSFHAELLAHEEQWWRWSKQKSCHGRPHRARVCNRRNPFSEGAISHLIVILQERDKTSGRKSGASLTARMAISVKRCLALIVESLTEATA